MAVPGRHYVSAAERAHKLCTESSVSISQENLEEWGLSGVQLRPYQLKGVSWLAERFASGYGCILGDEMGLGKTLQVGPCSILAAATTMPCSLTVHILAGVFPQAAKESWAIPNPRSALCHQELGTGAL